MYRTTKIDVKPGNQPGATFELQLSDQPLLLPNLPSKVLLHPSEKVASTTSDNLNETAL